MTTTNSMACHRVLYLTVFMAFFSSVSYAQQTYVADTLSFDEITVTATRIQQPLNHQPTSITFIDSTLISLFENQNIGELLASESSLFIKKNGPGSFSNASQRGLSSEQIQVLWEGIPINNVMLGQSDLSLLSADMFSNIQVSSGTPSTAFGGGSLAGALYLSSDWESGNRASFQQGIGSYGQWQTSMKGQYQSKGWNFSVRSRVDHAENDYQYYNRAYNREERRDHNRSEQEQVMATVAHESEYDSWESTIWFADSDNQIPGTILNNTQARQEDRSLRWLSTYQREWGETDITVKNYVDRVELNYFDSDINTESYSSYRRWMVSADGSTPFNESILLKGELSGSLTGSESTNYDEDHSRRQVSVLFNPEVVLFKDRFRIYPALRVDAYNDFGTVLSPSLGLNYEVLNNKLFLRGQLSKDFNPPTFNALYWGSGGNADLDAERSNSGEAGVVWTPYRATFSSLEVTGFYSQIDHGIRWYPDNNGRYSPLNIDQITTQGIEGKLENSIHFGPGIQLQLRQSISLTNTEITEPRFSGDNAVGHQMRYVPKWKYNASLRLQRNKLSGLLQYRWMGRRYTTDTEELSASLDPYQVVDATLQFQQEFFGLLIEARSSVKNIFDQDYEVVQWYPMPQRNFTFSLTATYQF
ncbi:TonB-dependent receptor plug domain-containing protein [Fodinibius sp. Rm-B-1B1-1]|uniref:TonB-dependent receptor plug domain-containing protein n=1 Tax=Fodinibius alkaliphilus TaxID=3140241 RepID=UPI003159DACB